MHAIWIGAIPSHAPGTRRIDEAEAVVAVLSPEDQSVPVESALAAAARKPQLVIADGAVVPRLVAGLPGVTDVVKGQDRDAVVGGVRELLNRRSRAEPPTAAR